MPEGLLKGCGWILLVRWIGEKTLVDFRNRGGIVGGFYRERFEEERVWLKGGE